MDLEGKAKDLVGSDLYAYGTGAYGFMLGVTQKQAGQNAAAGYRTNLAWQLKDFLSLFGIGGVTVAPGFTSVSGPVAFQPFNFILNKGFVVAVGLEVLDKLVDGRAVDMLKKALQPGAWGYAAGSVFDPPAQTRLGVGAGASAAFGRAQGSMGPSGAGAAGAIPGVAAI